MRRRFRLLRAHLQLLLCCQVPSRFFGQVKFPHPVGIVIGDGVTIGRDVRIYQNVTIGLTENLTDATAADYPTIEDGVFIYAGAVIAGGITVGKGAIIGANAVITRDVPSGAIAFGHNEIRQPGRDARPGDASGQSRRLQY